VSGFTVEVCTFLLQRTQHPSTSNLLEPS